MVCRILLLLLCSPLVVCAAVSSDGSVELEYRYFWESPATSEQSHSQSSVKLQWEHYRDWNNGNDTLVFEPFIRLDEQDSERSHIDLRQFQWSRLADKWELTAGLAHVFWGVAESQHLVDIINQTDLVENIDGEDKLGQPMLRYQYFSDFGDIDLYLLPLFRPRTFAGVESRLNGGFVVNPDQELYESDAQENHLDIAARYSRTFGDWSVGVSLFDGTSREPDLLRFFDPGTFETIAFYPQIRQLGVDLQLTTGAWLIKLEAIERDFDDSFYEDFTAFTTGFEYTFTGVFGSIYDLGVLAEYSRDERGEQASSVFQNDLFVGARWALNDIASSEVLLGFSQDLDFGSSHSIFVEASTRLANALTANIEVRYFSSRQPNDLLFRLRNDSFIQLGVEYFF